VAERHHFKLKLPNGAEVDFGGDREFVTEVYHDTKSAAIALFNREAAKTSREEAMDRLFDGAPPTELPEAAPPVPPVQPALPHTAPAVVATPASAQPEDDTKKKKPRPPTDPAKKDAKAARTAEIERILKAPTFDDEQRNNAALKNAEGPLDRAALVTRLAQDKFGIDGLSPAEVRMLLEKRFFIGQDKRALEEAMKGAPTSFFVARPAPFDGRAKLYGPMMGCIDHVNKLLDAHNNLRINSPPAASGNGATA
jgi:hypothetical protein